jgi:hypothetical protein
MVLRQWEASAEHAKYFSLFTQDRKNTQGYLLLEAQLVCRMTGWKHFFMDGGKI